jgi:murein L,D-transpeptidase YafK
MVKRTERALMLLLVLGGLGSLAGCSSQRVLDALPGEQRADHIVVVKSSHTLMLLARGRVLKEYRVALGRANGAKDHMGDHRTPEGEYVIDQKNAKSRFHLALHISYPNAGDSKRAKAEGLDPGNAIMLHGVQNGFGWLGQLQHDVDWTDGCIAVTNSEIEEIWRLVPEGTPIEIKP